MKLTASLFSVILLTFTLPAGAGQQSFTNAVISPSEEAEYMVSGVLRSASDGIVIKLVQGIKVAHSVDEAIGAFTREVLTQYPGYSLINTLASPVVIQKPQCGISI
jgi:hypothetical protein